MIIVTGGTHGIGRACVEQLVYDGLPVIFTGRDRQSGDSLAASLKGATYVSCDAAAETDCRRVVDIALSLGGGHIAGLVNNAGISTRASFATSEVSDWDQLMAVNARSAYLFTRFALQGLIAARGAVVNVSSIAGKVGEEGLAMYCASKAALIGLTQALALEFGDRVRFNAVCPGQIDTRMMSRINADPEARQLLERRIPAGRFGEPSEVAKAIAWLLSPDASYINGTVLAIDGGETAGVRTPRK